MFYNKVSVFYRHFFLAIVSSKNVCNKTQIVTAPLVLSKNAELELSYVENIIYAGKDVENFMSYGFLGNKTRTMLKIEFCPA